MMGGIRVFRPARTISSNRVTRDLEASSIEDEARGARDSISMHKKSEDRSYGFFLPFWLVTFGLLEHRWWKQAALLNEWCRSFLSTQYPLIMLGKICMAV